ncbi:MAG: cell division protein FtsZ [Chitinivibrionales bacterium]|nr:cell division protein FtsZ [Chitinivibrionales bacterium]MBD3356714.1 cell division protein FtsZ [Chitinivibrionales bacterium]
MVFTLDENFDAMAKMKVVGVGGAGGNAVNRMVTEGLSGVEFISVNTDAMALDNNRATHRIQIGERITKGLGAGANPEIGRAAMEEDRDKVASLIEGSDMVFITGGMGGGTGTGGAPVIAELAREMGILTVAIVTRPFLFEGKVRDKNAKKGIEDLRKSVDTIIVIPNQKLLSIVDRNTSLIDAFKTADQVLCQATKGISDLISCHGLVNLDFADVKTIMMGMGDALMGSGTSDGDNRAALAADAAIHSPLLDDISITGARGILINITGGEDMTLHDVSDATETIHEAAGENSETNIIFGAVIDPAMNGTIQVTVIATGFNDETLREKSNFASPKKTTVKVPQGKSTEDSRVEQMAIDLSGKREKREEPEASAERRNPESRNDDNQDRTSQPQEPEKPMQADPTPPMRVSEQAQEAEVDEEQGADSSSLQIPAVFKREKPQKENFFVSKGQVITQLEDDMDIPTFLRKQMQ